LSKKTSGIGRETRKRRRRYVDKTYQSEKKFVDLK
jgi:hypothetical protein